MVTHAHTDRAALWHNEPSTTITSWISLQTAYYNLTWAREQKGQSAEPRRDI